MPKGIYKRKPLTEKHKKKISETLKKIHKRKLWGFQKGNKIAKNRKISYIHSNNPNWKGGKIIRHGYYFLFMPKHPRAKKTNQRYIQEHIFIMEKKLGRYLDYTKEIVHHKNGNKFDNRVKNLKIISHSKHTKLHRHRDI